MVFREIKGLRNLFSNSPNSMLCLFSEKKIRRRNFIHGMEIRRAKREEMEKILDAYMDAYSEMEKYWYRRRKDARRYVKWLFKRDADGIFVAAEGEIVAFVASDAFWHSFHEGKVGEIHEMFVRKNHRRKGIGKKLIKRAEEYLFSQGNRIIELWVGEDNEAARKFYSKIGYEKRDKCGEWIRMVKIIGDGEK